LAHEGSAPPLLGELKGIMSFHDKIIAQAKPGETIYLTGTPWMHSATLKGYFRRLHEKRAKKKIKYKVLKPEHVKIRFIEEFPHTKVKYIPSKLDTPTAVVIFRSTVALIVYNVQPTLLRIVNKDLAETFKTYFETMWKALK